MPNPDYRRVHQRSSVLKNLILDLFQAFSSYFKLYLEVFIRKNFGERYITRASVITGAIFLLFFPFVQFFLYKLIQSLGGFGQYDPGQDSVTSVTGDFLLKYLTWYVFLILYIYFGFRRWKEMKRNPSILDGGRFTKSSGDIDDRFYEVRLFGKYPTKRQIEIFVEPALFFVIGIVLKLLGQSVGTLFIISSIFYCLSYSHDYKIGDDMVMDKLDDIKANQDLEDILINDKEIDSTDSFRGRRPTSLEMRQKVYQAFVKEEIEAR